MNRHTFLSLLFIVTMSKIDAKHHPTRNVPLNQILGNEGSTVFEDLISKLQSSEMSEKVNRCPEGWIFEGDACFYVNTDDSKVISSKSFAPSNRSNLTEINRRII